jgi:hypothetical protein
MATSGGIMFNTTVQEQQQTLLAQMETSLAFLAMTWRGTHQPDEARQLAHLYHTILMCMLEIGLDHPLDIDSELPTEWMPPSYIARFSA